jgi:transposase
VLTLGLTGRIWVCLQPQDGRKGIDGLAAVVTTQLGRDPLGGDRSSSAIAAGTV